MNQIRRKGQRANNMLLLPNDRTRGRKVGGRGRKIPAKDALDAALKAWCREHRLSLVREHKGIAGRQFSFDWAIPELKLALEFEGGMFGATGAKRCPVCKELPKASHFAIDRIIRDAEKYNLAAIVGWTVLRFIPTMIKGEDCSVAIEYVRKAVESKRLTRRV